MGRKGRNLRFEIYDLILDSFMRKCFIIFSLMVAGSFCFSQEIKKIKITDLQKTIKESKTPLIVNFWATYCIPCLEEIPYFQAMVKKYEKDSVKLLLVSL